MKIAIVGWGAEGQASYNYYFGKDHELTIHDQNPKVNAPAGVKKVLGRTYLDNLSEYDLIVRTAGLSPKLILDKNPGVEHKITTQINEFIKNCPTRNIVGVTGTKGKGTTSTLISKILEKASKEVFLGGNIGLPPFTFIHRLKPESWVVLELSSFQLIDLTMSPHLAVCLMVMPEHLDWHASTDEYFEAKAQLFRYQTAKDIAIYFSGSKNSTQIASASPGQKIPYYKPPGAFVKDGVITIAEHDICRTDELKLLGKHNWQNVCAAVTAAWQIAPSAEVIRAVLTSFSGLEHRLELISELEGVRYYDDSFGTTPDTAIVAIEAFDDPEIVILGGRGKGIPFNTLAATVAKRKNVKQVITIGEAGPEITKQLRQNGFNHITKGGKTIEEIARQAQTLAEPGDVVILSPACTSFDMFNNYKERGELFARAVRALI